MLGSRLEEAAAAVVVVVMVVVVTVVTVVVVLVAVVVVVAAVVTVVAAGRNCKMFTGSQSVRFCILSMCLSSCTQRHSPSLYFVPFVFGFLLSNTHQCFLWRRANVEKNGPC